MFAVCLAAGALTALLLFWTLRLDRADLRVPLNYGTDANIFLTRAKAISEGNWLWWNPRLGAPSGADWRDFPMNITLDSAAMWVLSRFTRSPGLIINLEWLIAIALTAALAAYSFVRLRFTAAIAISGAAIFALLPYIYFRGINHLHCLYYAVPLICLTAVELARGKLVPADTPVLRSIRHVPAYAWIACLLAGAAYTYTAFFSCFILLSAAGLAFLSRRDVRGAVLGCVLAAVIGVIVMADLSPSLLHWAREGRNASMLVKSPAEAHIYALKIRYLVTPVPGHPIPLVRRAEERLAPAKYPLFSNENEWGRLGLVGSIGFFVLLGVALAAPVNSKFASAGGRLLGPAAALTASCVLLGTAGGFGDFFNVFVSPDIRSYARVFPFIGFFSVMAAGVVLARVERRLPGALRIPAAVTLALLAAFDQAVPAARLHADRERLYRSDAAFVRAIEQVLPRDSNVFQLPATDFPNEPPRAKLLAMDLLRPYLHSSKYRWSWAAVTGTEQGEWNRYASALPVPAMLDALVHRGYSGLWVDGAGFEQSPEKEISQELGNAPLRGADGRFLFYDLRTFAAAQSAREQAMTDSERLAAHPIQATFGRGFYYEERGAGRVWHWSLQHGRITLTNPLRVSRRVFVEMRIEPARPGSYPVAISRTGAIDRVTTPGWYRRELDVPAGGATSLDVTCNCPTVRPSGSPRVLYFVVFDLAASDAVSSSASAR